MMLSLKIVNLLFMFANVIEVGFTFEAIPEANVIPVNPGDEPLNPRTGESEEEMKDIIAGFDSWRPGYTVLPSAVARFSSMPFRRFGNYRPWNIDRERKFLESVAFLNNDKTNLHNTAQAEVTQETQESDTVVSTSIPQTAPTTSEEPSAVIERITQIPEQSSSDNTSKPSKFPEPSSNTETQKFAAEPSKKDAEPIKIPVAEVDAKPRRAEEVTFYAESDSQLDDSFDDLPQVQSHENVPLTNFDGFITNNLGNSLPSLFEPDVISKSPFQIKRTSNIQSESSSTNARNPMHEEPQEFQDENVYPIWQRRPTYVTQNNDGIGELGRLVYENDNVEPDIFGNYKLRSSNLGPGNIANGNSYAHDNFGNDIGNQEQTFDNVERYIPKPVRTTFDDMASIYRSQKTNPYFSPYFGAKSPTYTSYYPRPHNYPPMLIPRKNPRTSPENEESDDTKQYTIMCNYPKEKCHLPTLLIEGVNFRITPINNLTTAESDIEDSEEMDSTSTSNPVEQDKKPSMTMQLTPRRMKTNAESEIPNKANDPENIQANQTVSEHHESFRTQQIPGMPIHNRIISVYPSSKLHFINSETSRNGTENITAKHKYLKLKRPYHTTIVNIY